MTTEATTLPAAKDPQAHEAIQAALKGLEASLTILKHYHVIGNGANLGLAPGTVAAPVQQIAVAPVRGAGGRFLPKSGEAATVAAKPKEKKAPKPEAYKKPTAPNTVPEFVKWFIQTDERNLYTVKRGQWECVAGVASDDPADRKAHVLSFYSRNLEGGDKNIGRHIVCIRAVGGLVPIFNASRIRYGNSWHAQANPQRLAEEYGAVPVPIEVVLSKENGVGLDPTKLEVLDWTGAETMLIPPVRHYSGSTNFEIINRHFAGAVLLKIENKYFLFDTDREEVKYHNFNPFFTQLPGAAKTVAEAYDLLAPKEVHAARSEGKDVIRQGEFFFVRVPDAEVIGDVIKDDFDRRTVEIILERADVLGAAVINGMHRAALESAREYSNKYPRIPQEGHASEFIADIRESTKGFTDYLAVQVGPQGGWDTETLDKHASGWSNSYIGEGHTGTRVDHYRAELSVRLHADHGGDKKYGIRFAEVLTSELLSGSKNSGRSNGHVATLLVVKPNANAKGPRQVYYARGAILHRGREHRPVYLAGFYRVYANTAVVNFTVHGDVD